MEFAVGILRIALGSILVLAGASKARDRAAFLDALGEFGMVPGVLRPLVSLLIPTAEIAVGAVLVGGLAHRAAAVAAATMIAVFTVGVAIRLARGGEGGCGCFGSLSRSRMGLGTIWRNAVLLVLAVLVFLAGPGAPALRIPPAR